MMLEKFLGETEEDEEEEEEKVATENGEGNGILENNSKKVGLCFSTLVPI